MFPGVNPKKMQAMMKQMGIAQEEIDANKVIIECDDRKIIINKPSVIKINMQGQENFQISGEVTEEDISEGDIEEVIEGGEEDKSEEDVKTIVEKTGCSEDDARNALEEAGGDLTEALLSFG